MAKFYVMKITKSTVTKRRPYFQSWHQSLMGLWIKRHFFQKVKNMNKKIC